METTPTRSHDLSPRPWPPPQLPSAFETVRAKLAAAAAAPGPETPAEETRVHQMDTNPERTKNRRPRGQRLTRSPAAVREKKAHAARGALGGRPPKWQDGETLTRLLRALADPGHPTKAAAARAAGISYPTLARWQAAHPELELLWRRGERGRYLARQRAKAERAAMRPRRPAPTKQMRLVGWFLTYRVHPEHALCEEHERRACARVNLPWERWLDGRERFPALMEKVHADRARRYSYLVHTGSIGINTKVVHPANPHRSNYPAECLYKWTRGGLMDDCYYHDRARSPRTGQRWL